MLENIREKETLPVGDEDRAIPTRIANLDTHIEFLKSQLDAIQRQIAESISDRDRLITRAEECAITTDENYTIVKVPVYPKKRVDVEALKTFPDKYELIVANIQSRINDKAMAEIKKAEGFIAQSDVKAVIRDKVVLAKVIPEPSEPERWDTTVVKRQ